MEQVRNVLIVEDSPTQALMLQHSLTQRGYHVCVARSAQEAIGMLSEYAVCVVVTEIVMPELDGYQLCRQIKSQEKWHDVPVLLLNSFADPEAAIKALDCGADNWIAKPYDEQSLVSALDDACANRSKLAQSSAAGSIEAIDHGRDVRCTPALPLLSLLLSTYQVAVQRTLELRSLKSTLALLQEGSAATPQVPGVERVMVQENPLNSQKTPDSSDAGVQSLHVLLAEDSAVNQQLTQHLLEKLGHTVVVAANGKQALEALRLEAFDLVLMDMEMPEMDGCQTTAQIRLQEQTSNWHVPIIAMTAHDEQQVVDRCLAAGMDGYASKPLQARELNEILNRASLAANSRPPQNNPAVFDRADAMERVDGDTDLLQDVLRLFQGEAPVIMDQIRQAVTVKDASALEQAAHKLKGNAAAIGAHDVAAAARELEAMGRQQGMSGANMALVALQQALDTLDSALVASPDHRSITRARGNAQEVKL
jgi:CheY-like chemotaxis protein